MKEKSYLLILLTIVLLPIAGLQAQEKKDWQPGIGLDIVSSYIWRGLPAYTILDGNNALAPSFQPYASLNYKGLEAGAWGSVDFTGTYKELDYYLSYTLHGFTLTVTDYYWAANWVDDNFFNYHHLSTSHYVEAALSYKGEKIPVHAMLGTMIYGADKKNEDPAKNNYSTYIEAGYALPVQDFTFDFFVGVTPFDGLYGDGYGGSEGFGFVNAGLTCSRDIKITEHFSLPVAASVITNPQAKKMYFVLALSI